MSTSMTGCSQHSIHSYGLKPFLSFKCKYCTFHYGVCLRIRATVATTCFCFSMTEFLSVWTVYCCILWAHNFYVAIAQMPAYTMQSSLGRIYIVHIAALSANGASAFAASYSNKMYSITVGFVATENFRATAQQTCSFTRWTLKAKFHYASWFGMEFGFWNLAKRIFVQHVKLQTCYVPNSNQFRMRCREQDVRRHRTTEKAVEPRQA